MQETLKNFHIIEYYDKNIMKNHLKIVQSITIYSMYSKDCSRHSQWHKLTMDFTMNLSRNLGTLK